MAVEHPAQDVRPAYQDGKPGSQARSRHHQSEAFAGAWPDLDELREETVGCTHHIHFDNAGSSLPASPTTDAMIDYLRAEEINGGYRTAADKVDDLDLVYSTTARYLGCGPEDVAFVQSAAAGWWRAFTSLDLGPGDRILVNSAEYQANAFGWLGARKRGVGVELVPNDSDGLVDLEALDDLLDDRVKLVSMTMIAMTNGAIQPAAEIGARIASSSARFLLDATQAAGQLRLDVTELGCDFLVYTGRKFMRGPRGTAILFSTADARSEAALATFVDGRSAVWESAESFRPADSALRFEFGEYGYAAKAGLGVATQHMLDVGIDRIANRVQTLAQRLRVHLRGIEGIELHDDGTNCCGIVIFTSDRLGAAEMYNQLYAKGMTISTPSQVNAQLDLAPRQLTQVARASVHYYNTEEEVDRFADAVDELHQT